MGAPLDDKKGKFWKGGVDYESVAYSCLKRGGILFWEGGRGGFWEGLRC